MKKYLCDIAVFAHIPLARDQFFWYTSTTKLTPGTLVMVPLFHRSVRGVVLACRNDFTASGNIRLKTIANTLHPNYFTHEQIALATHINETTFTSLGTVLQGFYTPPTAQRIFTEASESTSAKKHPPLSKTLRSISNDISKTHSRYASFLLRDTPVTARDALFAHSIKNVLTVSRENQVLVLLPEVLITEQTANRLRTFFPKESISVIHNKISKGALWSAYKDIADGKTRIIIGTKKALMQPFKNLSLIIVDEEHDMSFKQWERAPRFDTRIVADTLARMHSCPIVSVSAAPRITRTVPISLAPPQIAPPVTLVNMRQIRYEQNIKSKNTQRSKKRKFQLFSQILLDAIKKALTKNQQVLLFFNHKGMSAFSLCTDCHALLACPDCDRALVLVAEGHHECFHCDFKTSVFPRCNCGNLSFRNVGFGTQKIETMLAKLFPAARIARIDGHSMRATHAATELIERYENNEIDIILGTQMALKDWRNNRLSVVGIIDADALLSIPDIHADERLFAFVSNALGAVTHGRSTGHVYIQTYKPEYHLFKHAAKLDYDHFRRDTLKDRLALSYPPYYRVIKLILQHKDVTKTNNLAQDWRNKLRDLNTNKEPWLISNTHSPLLPKVRGLHRRQIIIRLKNPTKGTVPVPQNLAILLGTTPPRTIIDIDPVSLV